MLDSVHNDDSGHSVLGCIDGKTAQAALGGRREADDLPSGSAAGGVCDRVARHYEVNAKLVFTWLRDARSAPEEAEPPIEALAGRGGLSHIA